MTRYTCDGFRRESATDAAYVFAGRLARRTIDRQIDRLQLKRMKRKTAKA